MERFQDVLWYNMRHRKAFRPLAYDFPFMYSTTQKSKDMITEKESRIPISVQIYGLIAKHGLENIAQSMLHLCHEQADLRDDKAINDVIKHLENLVDASCYIQDWK